ncbi:helix-turn-helix domain-containing protein [Saccharopolyspora spinosa]|uniref:Excisionase family DNA binding protein n=1 Tax=Saccharopolyspora spinosa TaxID=60894 RepID=A0A2N3XT98_SACSN|nr:helix-turn-helix domain-containing protein [Saccharopolyspora spinosa]PKW13917.1 excisionase family DNA binding protein [Saccharopolyspora spinosa]
MNRSQHTNPSIRQGIGQGTGQGVAGEGGNFPSPPPSPIPPVRPAETTREGTREARECAPGNPRKTRFPAPDGRSLPLSRQPEEEPRELLTVEAAARRLSVSRTTMFRLLKSGDVASVRIGHARRVPAEAITAYVKRLAAEQHAA